MADIGQLKLPYDCGRVLAKSYTALLVTGLVSEEVVTYLNLSFFASCPQSHLDLINESQTSSPIVVPSSIWPT